MAGLCTVAAAVVAAGVVCVATAVAAAAVAAAALVRFGSNQNQNEAEQIPASGA